MKMLTPVIAAILLVASAVSNAASFNCAEARQPIEIAICSHPDLSQADEQLAATYRSLLGKLTPDGATKLKGVQRRFDKRVGSVCTQFDKDQIRDAFKAGFNNKMLYSSLWIFLAC